MPHAEQALEKCLLSSFLKDLGLGQSRLAAKLLDAQVALARRLNKGL